MLMALVAVLVVCVLYTPVAHAQSAIPTVETVTIASGPGTDGIHTPSHEHTPAPPLTSPDKNIEEKP